MGRGLAVGDLDNDGRIDALIVAQNEPLVVFSATKRRGSRSLPHHSAGGDDIEPRRGGGAGHVRAGGRTRVGAIGGGSYQSASDPRLHFGLGTSDGSNRSRFDGLPDDWINTENLRADRAYRAP